MRQDHREPETRPATPDDPHTGFGGTGIHARRPNQGAQANDGLHATDGRRLTPSTEQCQREESQHWTRSSDDLHGRGGGGGVVAKNCQVPVSAW